MTYAHLCLTVMRPWQFLPPMRGAPLLRQRMGLPFHMPMRLIVTRPRVPGLVGRQNFRPACGKEHIGRKGVSGHCCGGWWRLFWRGPKAVMRTVMADTRQQCIKHGHACSSYCHWL